VAVGILAASGQIVGSFDDAVFMGELSLDGEVRSVHGVLPKVALARKNGKLLGAVPIERHTAAPAETQAAS
jgi:magnesium chelatase family protein